MSADLIYVIKIDFLGEKKLKNWTKDSHLK